MFIRRLGPSDRPAVEDLHGRLPADDVYLRFFTGAPASARVVAEMVTQPDTAAFGAFHRGGLVGVAHYRREPGGRAPEIAVAVARPEQRNGVGSLLLEQLVASAIADGLPRVVADVLTVNHGMLRVIEDLGLPHRIDYDGPVSHVVIDMPRDEDRTDYLDAVLARQASADEASLRALLEPRSVAVIGAGRRAESVGRMVLCQIRAAGFSGPLHVVNPRASTVAGMTCYPSVDQIPAEVDLAVLAVPASQVGDVAEQCGRRGVRALLVVTSGVSTDSAASARLVDAARRYGMRIVGPNSLGVLNTDPQVRLRATFGRGGTAGEVGVAAQSGGVVIGLTSELDRLGLGVSTALSTGDSIDVNGDDMLLWWADDARTRAAVLYVESFRRPEQFTEIARRLARRAPVVAIRSGSSTAGQRAATSHSAAGATPAVVREALFDRAGVLAVDDLTQAVGALAVLCWQPPPAGPRVAVLSNAGGGGVLAADACARHGLVVAPLSEVTRARLARLLPATASVGNPVDTTATVSAETFADALKLLTTAPEIDAVMVITVATQVGDPAGLVAPAAAHSPGKPVIAVRFGQPVGVVGVAAGAVEAASVPRFADPSAAAHALALAVRRSRWLHTPDRPAPIPDGVDLARAREIVTAAMAGHTAAAAVEDTWLAADAAYELLAAARVPTAPARLAWSAEEAARCWRQIGGPVVLKADAPGLLHKSRAGGVLSDLRSCLEVEDGYRTLAERFGERPRGVLVQPLVPAGSELLIGVTRHPPYGALLSVGLGGTNTDIVNDRAHRLLPATAADLDELLDAPRGVARMLAADRDASCRDKVADVIARMAWLATALPEIAEAEINPLILTSGTVTAVDVRIRLAPATPDGAWLRTLPF
ncbi:bifunctional GNAT family N-acetyltransferase/acetate--CoA ligase family protein [Pseudonocardia eucalypti]|uniref:Bifunctional GNAT family N-acetyltransferase/acetate--CoA ligase family protein n=1 Tax=Pseudonocardia eucalypti TaxID=648755 RepID=A0ABP9QI76_9PSEU